MLVVGSINAGARVRASTLALTSPMLLRPRYEPLDISYEYA
jgi:hypothetical protein